MIILKKFFLIFCLAVGPMAQPTLATAQTSDLVQAQVALQDGDFALAQERAVLIAQSHPLDSVLIIARSSLELGQLDQAERFAKRAIEMAPGLADPRTMLGLVYLRQGRNRLALIPLRRALDLARPGPERARVQTILRQVQGQFQFRYFGGAGFLPSDNIGKATTADDLTLAATLRGLAGQFDPGETDTGVGFQYNIGASYRFLPSTSGQIETFGQYSKTDYSGDSFDFESIVVGGVWTLPLDVRRSRTTFTWRRTQFHKTDNQDYIANSYTLRTVQPLFAPSLNTARHSLDASLTFSDFNREESPSNYDDSEVSLTYTYLSNPTTRWSFGLRYLDRDGAESETAYAYRSIARRQIGAHIGRRANIGKSSWISDVTLGVKFAEHDFVEFFHSPEIRWERDWTVNVTLENPAISYFGFTPTISASVLDRDSNHEFRTLKSTDMFVGFKNAF